MSTPTRPARHHQQVICWILGEYGHLAPVPPAAVAARLLAAVLHAQKASDSVRAYLVSALTKLAAHGGLGLAGLPPEGRDLVRRLGSSQSLELQQRAYELQALLG